jgi:hypothetical protein
MIKIQITSDARAEGKTNLAVKLLQANPDFLLCVRNAHQMRSIIHGYALPLSISGRIVVPETNLSGTNYKVMIEDLS